AFERMDLRTTGMEFASEMVIKSTLLRMRIAEVPIVLHKDGRSRAPHLRSWRDGWRHLRLMLLFSPSWLFVVPGIAFLIVGLLAGGYVLGGPQCLERVAFAIHGLLASSFLVLVGFQVLVFGICSKAVVITEGAVKPAKVLSRRLRRISLEVGLVAGLGLVLGGLVVFGLAL